LIASFGRPAALKQEKTRGQAMSALTIIRAHNKKAQRLQAAQKLMARQQKGGA